MPTVHGSRLILIMVVSAVWWSEGCDAPAHTEAAQTSEVVTVTPPMPDQDNGAGNKSVDLRSHQGWTTHPYVERLFQRDASAGDVGSTGPSLHLKARGMLPGMELGLELHSLQAFQSVLPAEHVPKLLQGPQEQPLLLPPSVNVPDYNGGFLRFTW